MLTAEERKALKAELERLSQRIDAAEAEMDSTGFCRNELEAERNAAAYREWRDCQAAWRAANSRLVSAAV